MKTSSIDFKTSCEQIIWIVFYAIS